MAYWQDFVNTPKGFSYWAEIAWSILRGMVLDSVLDTESDTHTHKNHRLFRRMYWSCFMIDRLISLASRAPSTLVCAEGIYQKNLELSDFDIAPFSETTLLGYGLDLGPEIASVEHQQETAKSHIAAVKLCLHLGNAVCNPNDLRYLDTQRAIQKYMAIDHELSDLFTWYNYFTPMVCDLGTSSRGEKKLALRQSILSIIFHAAVASLLSQQALLLEMTPQEYFISGQGEELQEKRFIATSTVTAVFLRLQSYGFLQYIPPCVMALLLPATVMHFMRSLSRGNLLSKTLNDQYLSQSLDAFCEMGQISSCAQRWKKFLEDLVERQKQQQSPV